MTAIPLALPVKASEAAALADLIIQQLDGRPITDDQRNRLSARATALELVSIRPHWGSLQKDPVHGGTYYLAADGTNPSWEGSGTQSLLLRVALASAPASGLFPKAILVGRMRPGGGREVVVNAIPFGPADGAAIQTFAAKVDTAFLPRAHGTQPSITLAASSPEEIAAGFEAFRSVHKSLGANLACFEAPLGLCVWAAVRAGWRHGYSAAVRLASSEEAALSEGYSRYIVEAASVEAHASIYDAIRSRRAELALARAFDYEMVNPADPAAWLHEMKAGGRPVQILSAGREAAEVARHSGVVLGFSFASGEDPEGLRELSQATAGRWNCAVSSADAVAAAADALRRS